MNKIILEFAEGALEKYKYFQMLRVEALQKTELCNIQESEKVFRSVFEIVRDVVRNNTLNKEDAKEQGLEVLLNHIFYNGSDYFSKIDKDFYEFQTSLGIVKEINPEEAFPMLITLLKNSIYEMAGLGSSKDFHDEIYYKLAPRQETEKISEFLSDNKDFLALRSKPIIFKKSF